MQKEPEYKLTAVCQKISRYHFEKMKRQDNRVDVEVDTNGIRKCSARGKLFKFKRKA